MTWMRFEPRISGVGSKRSTNKDTTTVLAAASHKLSGFSIPLVFSLPANYESFFQGFAIFYQACGGYIVTFLLFFAMFVFALARLFTAIWLQIWLDAGDGRAAERAANATALNITLTDSELKGYITHNPDLWFYQVLEMWQRCLPDSCYL